MTLVRCNPARDLWRMRDDMDKVFSQFFSRPYDGDEFPEVDWSPRVDISEKDAEYLVRADLPGLSKEEVKITLHDNVLTIRGEKKEEVKEESKNYHLCERRYGKFMRSFRLPTQVDNLKIDANFKDGVLTIALPKSEAAKPKEIEIKMN